MPINEAARELGLHRSTISRYLKQGKVKRYEAEVGRIRFVDLDELLALTKPKPATSEAR